MQASKSFAQRFSLLDGLDTSVGMTGLWVELPWGASNQAHLRRVDAAPEAIPNGEPVTSLYLCTCSRMHVNYARAVSIVARSHSSSMQALPR